MAISDADLRDYGKGVSPDCIETENVSGDGRQNVQAEKVHQPICPGRETKETICRLQKAFRILQPLFVVTLQELLVGRTANNQSQFPGQVVTVLNSGIHSLRAGGGVNVRRIAGDETATSIKLVYVTNVYLVAREPFDIVNVEIEFCFRFDSLFNFFVQNVAFIFVEFFGKYADYAIALFAFEWKENHE